MKLNLAGNTDAAFVTKSMHDAVNWTKSTPAGAKALANLRVALGLFKSGGVVMKGFYLRPKRGRRVRDVSSRDQPVFLEFGRRAPRPFQARDLLSRRPCSWWSSFLTALAAYLAMKHVDLTDPDKILEAVGGRAAFHRPFAATPRPRRDIFFERGSARDPPPAPRSYKP